MLGVTSIVRALNLDNRCYNTLIDYFHSSAVKLDRLTALWTVVLRLFPSRCACFTLGASWSATASRSPSAAARCRRSNSCISPEANTKPEFIMGHSLQAVSLLVQAAPGFFAVPLAVASSGLVWSQSRSTHPARQNAHALRHAPAVEQPFYFVADA